MKKAFLLFTIVLIPNVWGNQLHWDSHSAYLLPAKKWSVGVFQPLRYGIKNDLEMSIHPVWFFINPNLSIKFSLPNFKSFKSSSKLSFIYPTPLLNMLAREGIGGLIDPNFTIPPMLGVSGSLLLSKRVLDFNTTFKAGVDLGMVMGDLDTRANIDLPIVYHRLEVFQNGWGCEFGFDINKNIFDRFRAHMDIDIRLLPDFRSTDQETYYSMHSGDYAIEHKMLLIWEHSSKFRIITGYKLVHGEYPYGKQTRLLPYFPLIERWLPMIEFQWLR